jgi:cytochrome P450
MWAVLRHADARALLTDPRFGIREDSFLRPDVPADCLPYLHTMSELDGAGHARLRRLVAPAFSARRAAAFRPRIESIVTGLLDALPRTDPVDLLAGFARPLPMEVICELVGIPAADRPAWREWGAAVAAGHGPAFAAAIPGIIDGAREAVARRRARPADDLLSELLRAQAEDGDRLDDTELVTLVWQLVLAGQTPTNLIANAVAELLARPAEVAALRADPALPPGAVEELIRWCGPALLTIPRYAREDAELCGTPVRQGDAVTAVIASANRDPRAFADPDRLDLRRTGGPSGQLGFAHGPHFCLGASLARAEVAVALGALLRRFPELAAVPGDCRAPDPGTWRLTGLPVALSGKPVAPRVTAG